MVNEVMGYKSPLYLNKKGTQGIFCECKFRNKPMPMEEYDDLVTATKAFPSIKNPYLIFISKSGFTAPVEKRAKDEHALLFTLQDLFHDTVF